MKNMLVSLPRPKFSCDLGSNNLGATDLAFQKERDGQVLLQSARYSKCWRSFFEYSFRALDV